ncbi:hypothetical protein F5J12DRAFT_780559 [Pisolithus orientalis]|uniref:uncharacterized protein n=1 Tax=Pisolithus orientalis TaxID=936130 RepID=UPI0022258180|nr:uncharacterized protein F5J12DRAFT_780559 [Pisolithus orientalis]KAI6025743.1 hypothetical protein F5J12DRAFT_780559 [Pisolithus orientalis]
MNNTLICSNYQLTCAKGTTSGTYAALPCRSAETRRLTTGCRRPMLWAEWVRTAVTRQNLSLGALKTPATPKVHQSPGHIRHPHGQSTKAPRSNHWYPAVNIGSSF